MSFTNNWIFWMSWNLTNFSKTSFWPFKCSLVSWISCVEGSFNWTICELNNDSLINQTAFLRHECMLYISSGGIKGNTWMDSMDSAWLKSKVLGWFLKTLTVFGPLAAGPFSFRLCTLTTCERKETKVEIDVPLFNLKPGWMRGRWSTVRRSQTWWQCHYPVGRFIH